MHPRGASPPGILAGTPELFWPSVPRKIFWGAPPTVFWLLAAVKTPGLAFWPFSPKMEILAPRPLLFLDLRLSRTWSRKKGLGSSRTFEA